MIQVKRQTNKITLYHMSWTDYCQFCKEVSKILARSEQITVEQKVMALVIMKLQRRLAKGDHYPLKDHFMHPHHGKKFIVHLEPEEALCVWHLYPYAPGDPVRSVISLEFPKYFR